MTNIKFRLANEARLLTHRTDVLALKCPQDSLPEDTPLIAELGIDLKNKRNQLPEEGESIFIPREDEVGPKSVLLVGVRPEWDFTYRDSHRFGEKVIAELSAKCPEVKTLSLCVAENRFVVDKESDLLAATGGILKGLAESNPLPSLDRINFFAPADAPASELKRTMEELFPNDGELTLENHNLFDHLSIEAQHAFRLDSHDRATDIFVAMPINPGTQDLLNYPIKHAAKRANLTCERIDESHINGRIFDVIRTKIKESKVVVADLTGLNANVFLEVGYAWGVDKPTILLWRTNNKPVANLPFDVADQNCLMFETETELEDMLVKALNGIKRGSITRTFLSMDAERQKKRKNLRSRRSKRSKGSHATSVSKPLEDTAPDTE